MLMESLAGLMLAGSAAAVIEEVQVTASRRNLSNRDSVQAITVMDEEALRASLPQVTADVFRGQAGVFIQQTTPGQGVPIVRGLKGSEVLHLVDGTRMNNAFFRNAPNQYVALLDVGTVERVEVVRGPVSTLYGADAMGGVVQFVTRQPEFRDETGPDTEPDWQTDLVAGTSDRSLSAWGAVEGGRGDTAYRLQLGYQDVGDRRTADGEVVPSSYESRSFNGSLRQRIDDNSELQFSWQHLRQPGTPRSDELVPGFGEDQPASSEFYFEPNQRNYARLGWSGDTSWGVLREYQLNLSYQEVRDDRRTRDFESPLRNLENNTSELWSLNGQFRGSENEWVDWVYGFEINQDTVRSQRRRQDLEQGDTFAVSSRFPDGSTQDSFAVYLHGRSELTSALTVEGGLRYSAFDIDLTATQASPAADLDPDELTFSLGMNWALTPGLNLVANVGEGFRAPNIFDLGTLGPRPGNRFNVANPELGPERLLGYDLGLKWADGNWSGQWVVFASDYEDKITSVATGELTDAGRTVVRSENLNEVELYGTELSARWQGDGRWSAYAMINAVRGTESDEFGQDEPADRVPPLNGRLGLQLQWSDTLDLSAYADAARRQDRLSSRDVRDPRINPTGTPGWATLNLSANWEARPGLSVGLRLRNLLDRAYREHGSGLDARGRDLVLSISANW